MARSGTHARQSCFQRRTGMADVNIDEWKFVLVILASALACGAARAEGAGDPAVASSDNGKYADKDGNPTYKVSPDGVVDWYTYSGFRRYHSDCHVCHGPNGEGSSYAPALANSLKTLSYSDFVNIVTNGRKNVDAANDKVMPAFATNVNVMCFIDDIYVYLRARANDAIPGGRPPSHEDKPEAAKQAEASCTGIK
ncbi:c-type cytochrome, methanol metabolism-related [Bradyrhizobium sp.]|uniref:c-type cytochrome, methanol metabolism-related n=1 Tax=Bradyrhizobium sp. TaxID=376 RepID=UPI003BB0BC63